MRDQSRRFVSAERGPLDAAAAAWSLPRRRGGRSDALVDAGVAAAVSGAAPPSSTARTRPTPSARRRDTHAGSARVRRRAFVPGGASAAVAWLEADKWARAEHVRPRPVLLLYEMVREKIEAHYPTLPRR